MKMPVYLYICGFTAEKAYEHPLGPKYTSPARFRDVSLGRRTPNRIYVLMTILTIDSFLCRVIDRRQCVSIIYRVILLIDADTNGGKNTSIIPICLFLLIA